MKYSFEKVFIVILAIVIQTLYTGVKKITKLYVNSKRKNVYENHFFSVLSLME